MKSKPTKVRPPRVYRTKTGRPYIKYKGKKIYLNFGKKTNDLSTLNIIKLFLKYLTKKKRSTATRRPKSVIEKPEQENRDKVHMQIEKYLSDKYARINEMDKIEEKKRKEAKERAEEKKRGDEAKARQELLDADERKRDIDRAIERERKLQAELKADRVVSQTVLRQLTASNDRIERLIEEGKNVARDVARDAARDAVRDVKERANVEAIPIEDAPRRERKKGERKRVEEKGEEKGVDDRGDRNRVDDRGEEKGVEYRVIEDVTAISNAEEAKKNAEKAAREAEQAKLNAEQAKQRAEVDAKKAIDDAEKSIKAAKKRQQKSEEDAEKAKKAKRIAEEATRIAEQAKQRAEDAAKNAKDDVDKTVREAAAARADAKKSKREAEDAKVDADKSKKEAADAQKLAEKSKNDAEDAKKQSDEYKKESKRAKREAKRSTEELKKAVEAVKEAREDVQNATKEVELAREEADKYKKEADENKKDAEKAREESEIAEAKTKNAVRNGVIDAMFDRPIPTDVIGKMTPKAILKNLEELGMNVEEVKKSGKRLNEKETVKGFLRAHPEEVYLGDNAETGWRNLLIYFGTRLNAVRKARAAEAKVEEKTEAQEESEANEEVADFVESDNDDDLVEESDDEQGGSGAKLIKDACVKIIDKLKVGDIKKFLKKTHTDAYRKKYRHKGKLLKFNYIEALMLAMADEKIRSAVCSELAQRRGRREGSLQPSKLNPQAGVGAGPLRGLTTAQLDGLMADEKRYLGTVASDEINTLKPNGTKYAFIMNTDKASKPGQHWIAVFISGKDDKTVEVYDPLGTYEPTKEFLEQIKTLVDKMNLDHYLLLKVNKIKNQSDTSDTCGWFAVKFIKERFLGNRFKFSTGLTQLKEDEIQKYKKQNGYGFDTYL